MVLLAQKRTIKRSKSKNFPLWFNDVVFAADIVDPRYPLKGCYVWKPHGFKALKLMMGKIEHMLEETGHGEAYFPSLVPMSVFSKEADFLKGFGGESLRITHVGEKKLEEELVFRPTSETVMYEMFSLWIHGKKDLPIRLYQTVNVFRYETKQTRPLLRVREIVKFKEAHTVHATAEEADEQIKIAKELYCRFFSSLLLPFKVLKTPSWDTFAGAEYNFDFLTVLPDGKALELGSVINLGQKFAKAFNIKFMDEQGKERYPYQTCYGLSERTLGAVIAVHGDDLGIRFPSEIAPKQIVIVPIVKKDNTSALGLAQHLFERLRKSFRVALDDRNESPGEKFYYWDARGVPLRLEIGPREVEKNEVCVALRTGKKLSLLVDADLERNLRSLLAEHDQTLKEEAERFFSSFVFIAESLDDGNKWIEEKRAEGLQPGMLGFGWCGSEECGLKLEEILDMPSLGFEPVDKKLCCPICGKPGKNVLFFGRTY